MTEKWETYEEVAACLLSKIKSELKLKSIEGKQKLVGRDTGTEWEIDAKGIVEGGDGIVLVECRRYTTSKQNQEKIAALAYRIHDTKAEGGIMVSPLGLQTGAEKVADANNIKSIEIDANSTPENFTIRFLNKLFIGIADRVRLSDEVTVTVVKKCKSCGNSFEQIKNEIFCPDCT